MKLFSRRVGSLAVVAATFGALIVAGAPSAAADTGVTTASPDTFANTATAQVVTISDPLAPTYSALPGGVTVRLVGPGNSTDTYTATSPTIDSSTITATFDMTSLGLPAAPGSYLLTVSPASTPPTPLPADSVAITITAGRPTPAAALAVQPGGAAPASVVTFGTPFARGDVVSFTDSTGSAVPGLSLTDTADPSKAPSMSATAVTGAVRATADVPLGRYNLAVTDTAQQVGTCSGCVVVTDLGPVTDLKAVATVGSAATVTFTPPTGSTPAVTGYDVKVSKTASKSTSDTGIVVTQTGTTPRASVSGLTPATKYFVTVTAKSAGGDGVPTVAAFFTPRSTTLTIASTREHVTAGKPLTLIGQLTHKVGSAASAMSSKKVLLYAKVRNSAPPVKLVTVRTDTSGRYRYAFKPRQTASYVAVFRGSRSTPSAPGDSLTFAVAPPVAVRSKVGLRAHVTQHAGGSWLVLDGTVKPKQQGRTVIIDRIGPDGRTKLGTATLTGRSTFELVEKHLTPGTYHLRARVTSSSTSAAAHSKRLTVRL